MTRSAPSVSITPPNSRSSAAGSPGQGTVFAVGATALASSSRSGRDSTTVTELAPHAIAWLTTDSPSIPAPSTMTDRPRAPPPTRRIAAAVATAQLAVAAASAERPAGSRTMAVPHRSTMWLAKPPASGWSSFDTWPYLKSRRHFWGRPPRQRSHSPHDAHTLHVTRSPQARVAPATSTTPAPDPRATTVPAISWPRIVGSG